VAGLILDRLGRVPDQPGDRVDLAEWVLEVGTVHRHAITEVRATPRGSDDVTTDLPEEPR
jgi:putative hemolysin